MPEQFGFLPKRVTPFSIATEDHEQLYAWYVPRLELYRHNEGSLLVDSDGRVSDITSPFSFEYYGVIPMLDWFSLSTTRLGPWPRRWGPESYRSLYAEAPDSIHVIALEVAD